ncbi:flavodoxin family protein [Pontibacter akesuensis]|uniref:Multimeric flavodoxin WrbA n=1 Tax=Pontibacter akesuensis TaxID=388950 RepID=A0A1I7G5B1_9BACT|nr:NAD(P)H-dependent oxidoreductase [Pontibacter akesuensis]GHA58752.1 hypothetical protein GCM10007389_08340 [Pontibacter akesuensis]SFU43624.1 Multimeric flavodoxin WrbA [Pontibacter akesuensis]
MAEIKPDKKPLVLLASARYASATERLVKLLLAQEKYTCINLLDFEINSYSYSGEYAEADAFLKVVRQMQQHEKLIFATPVYWYAMSGLLKIFFDRLTDLVTIEKQMGRSLKGKEVYVLAVGSDEALPLGFEEPFRLTAAYFDMTYAGCYYRPEAKLIAPLPGSADFLRRLYL